MWSCECPEDLAGIYLAPHAPRMHTRAPCPSGAPCSPDCGQRPLLPGAGTSPHPSWCHLCALFAPDFLVLWGSAVTGQEHAA